MKIRGVSDARLEQVIASLESRRQNDWMFEEKQQLIQNFVGVLLAV
jgi:hypothetical protein